MFTSEGAAYCVGLVETNRIFESNDIERNRSILARPLMGLSLSEAYEFGCWLRNNSFVDQFVRSLLLIAPEAVHPEVIGEFWQGLLRSGRVDFCVEILSYASYTSVSNGCFARNTVVDIYDYEAARAAIFHETFHTFNFVHGPVGGGWNEGSAIALPKWYEGDACHLGETVFGTVLYYRDIGIEGYPKHIEIGGPWQYDQKGQEFTHWLMQYDVSGVNWFNPQEVRRTLDIYWAPLNRNVAWEDWLASVEEATRRIKRDKGM